MKRFGNGEPSFGYKIGFHLKAVPDFARRNVRKSLNFLDYSIRGSRLHLFFRPYTSVLCHCSQFIGLLAIAPGTEMKTVWGFDLMRCRI